MYGQTFRIVGSVRITKLHTGPGFYRLRKIAQLFDNDNLNGASTLVVVSDITDIKARRLSAARTGAQTQGLGVHRIETCHPHGSCVSSVHAGNVEVAVGAGIVDVVQASWELSRDGKPTCLVQLNL